MIYTFYSYKGGVGRSMALANIGEIFYKAGLKVLMVDWDLEAPGLERFFEHAVNPDKFLDKLGVIDMLLAYKKSVSRASVISESEEKTSFIKELEHNIIPIPIYPPDSEKGKLWLLTAGRRSEEYFSKYANVVLTFDWSDFYENWKGAIYIEWVRQQFEQMADIVLIDSRTGVTEMGGVCTYHLADVVIMFCAPNQQNLNGTYRMARNFTDPKVRDSRKGRPLNVLIVPARIERAEGDLVDEFQEQFIKKFSNFQLPEEGIDIQALWNLGIPYVPKYAFKETLAVHESGLGSSKDMEIAFHELSRVIWRLNPLDLLQKVNILIIDNDTEWLENYQSALSGQEYGLKFETDLESALYQLNKASFDLVIAELLAKDTFSDAWSESSKLVFDKVASQRGAIIIVTDAHKKSEEFIYTLPKLKLNYDEQIKDILFKDRLSIPELQEVIRRVLKQKKRPARVLSGEKELSLIKERYADFDIYIASDGRIVTYSNEGEVTSEIHLTVPDKVTSVITLIEQNRISEPLLKDFGKMLYGLLFHGKIHSHFKQTETMARNSNQTIRIWLTVEPDMLARLPWELIYHENGYFLSINPKTILIRSLNLPTPTSRITRREGPLQVLIIIASPTDLPPLNPDKWERIIINSLAQPLREGKVTIRTIKQASRREISKALLEQKPDIVQFIGHGFYREGKGYLALVDGNTGQSWQVDDAGFANMFLGSDEHLGLVSLIMSESAKSDSPQSFLGIAPQLVQRGVPIVIAMQYNILRSTGRIFLEEFYRAVAARKPVDWSVQWARNAIALDSGLDNREFASPVLYMRTKDGNIF